MPARKPAPPSRQPRTKRASTYASPEAREHAPIPNCAMLASRTHVYGPVNVNGVMTPRADGIPPVSKVTLRQDQSGVDRFERRGNDAELATVGTAPDGPIVSWWPSNESQPRCVGFFAAEKPESADSARAMWDALYALTGAGPSYESEAAHLIVTAIDYELGNDDPEALLTRTKLAQIDSRVLKAARDLLNAVHEHPTLRTQRVPLRPGLAAGLLGLGRDQIDEALNELSARERITASGPTLGDVISDRLQWMPSYVEVIEMLGSEAKALQEDHRRNDIKQWTDRSLSLLRRLAGYLADQHPDATPAQIAAVVGPVLEVFDGTDRATVLRGVSRHLRDRGH